MLQGPDPTGKKFSFILPSTRGFTKNMKIALTRLAVDKVPTLTQFSWPGEYKVVIGLDGI